MRMAQPVQAIKTQEGLLYNGPKFLWDSYITGDPPL